MPNFPTLVIEYKLPRGALASKYLKKRHALEDFLDTLLRKNKLGDCDGGGIGSGTMEVFCDVKDYAKARAIVVKAIKATPFADFARIYKIAPEKPAPKSRSASFQPGDCLAIRDGRRWGAAYVEAVAPDGSHIVVTLDYLDTKKPDLAAFRRMKALVLTHHDCENAVEVTVESRPSKDVHSRVEVIGNAPRKFRNVEVENYKGSWVNWKQRPDRITREINREMESRDRDKAAGRYLAASGGAWVLTTQVKLQRAWDARRKR